MEIEQDGLKCTQGRYEKYFLSKNSHNRFWLTQYTQLIARRVRELGVFSEIQGWDAKANTKDISLIRGVILSGGPESVTEGLSAVSYTHLRAHET